MHLKVVFCLTITLFFICGGGQSLGQLAASAESTNSNTEQRPQPFKVVSQVFVGDEATPASCNDTIFQQSTVYDFRYSGDRKVVEEISIYEPESNNFELLDCLRKKKLKVNQLQLARLLSDKRNALLANETAKSVYLDDFQAKFDGDSNRVNLTGEYIQYRAECSKPDQIEKLRAYHQFLEAFTLVSAIRTQATPPFARMRLNEEVKTRQLFPNRIDLVLRENPIRRSPLKAHSTHRWVGQLTTEDLAGISDAKNKREIYEAVDLTTYCDTQATADRSDGARR